MTSSVRTRHSRKLAQRRSQRVRSKLRKVSGDRMRRSMHRSGKHIYAQIIDDRKGVTLAAASSKDKESGLKTGANVEAAATVGKLIAERALAAGVDSVAFDRGGFKYHGRIKALADSARENGLKF